MKSLAMCVMGVLLASAVVAADFSGTWVLNTEKSELGEGRRGRMAATKMVVTQENDAITIKSTRMGRDDQERTSEEKLTLDGKESKRSTDWADIVSSAKIDGKVLIILQTRTFERDGQTREMESEQKWTLVDGALVIDMKAESPRGERVAKMVYDKE